METDVGKERWVGKGIGDVGTVKRRLGVGRDVKRRDRVVMKGT